MTTQRTTTSIATEITAKQARHAELTARLAEVEKHLSALRKQRARSLADGGQGPSAADITALSEEQDALESAIELLDDELAALEQHSQQFTYDEALAVERAAIGAAIATREEFVGKVRRFIESEMLPGWERVLAELSEARNAEKQRRFLAGKMQIAVSEFVKDSDKVLERTGLQPLMLAATAYMRATTNGKPGIPPNVTAPSAQASDTSDATGIIADDLDDGDVADASDGEAPEAQPADASIELAHAGEA